MRRPAALVVAMLVSTAALAAADDVFMARVNEMVAGRGEFKSYEPREAVPGATGASLPRTATPTIAAEALKSTRDYAARNNSSAYIVWRNGKIEDETYFGTTTAATPIVSKSLAKPITALAIGRAIQLGKIKSLDQPVADRSEERRVGKEC